MNELENCPGCDHFLSRHYKDVKGIVRCLNINLSYSSSGVVGLSGIVMCDCTDYASESTTIKRERKAEENSRFDEAVHKITEGIKQSLAQKEAEEPKICTTSGKPIDEHTREINPATGQQNDYIVLCEEERKKGFVRPYRDTYKHVGQRPTNPLRDLTEEENERYSQYGYVKYEKYPEQDSIVGRFWTEEQLNSGCGAITTMKPPLAETYAAKPGFYGGTFCCACGKHFPVCEFIWTADGSVVGS